MSSASAPISMARAIYTHPRDLRIGIGHRRNHPRGPFFLVAGSHFRRQLAFVRGLVRQHRVADADHWMINLQGQYLNTCRANFDNHKGDLSRANAVIEYRLTDTFGIFAGYDGFKLDADQRGSDGVMGLKQEFKGLVAGVSLSF